MVIHYHTKTGYKRLSGSGDIVRTNSCIQNTDTVIPIYPHLSPLKFAKGGSWGRGDNKTGMQNLERQNLGNK